MNTERWLRIEALFDQTIDLPEAERSRFLEQACGGDSELCREVRALLANAPTAGIALRKAIAAEVELLASEVATAQVGRRIGRFRVIRLLGEGGMGSVYLAARADAQFAHRVAIKLLAGSDSSAQAIARFRDERQILAALEHPNIVRLLDGGNTDDGLPYLVMEHIEGATITRYADQHRLSVRARVGLVRQVCAALQYAHQNLVVHRDIKPSNVLVDAEGAPKILDFGIAKLLAPTASFGREARTRTGVALFTPEYASPEQARGGAVSTATDVYSVGAVLYELVTGRPPHRIASDALAAIRVICEVDPDRPSAAGPRDRRRELAGDLDNIILKALHKEPARRYASMEQLSDDLRRWLEGLPVAARPSTVGYRARKFIRRNKGIVLATLLVAASLLGATVISVRQASRADHQAMMAETERARAFEAAAIADTERARAIEAAIRAQMERDRALKAEARGLAQLDQIKAEQAARAIAEEEARAKRIEAERSRERLRIALDKARREKTIAEQESLKAREAETRAQAAVYAEILTRQEAQLLYQRERERVRQLEEASRKITTSLP